MRQLHTLGPMPYTLSHWTTGGGRPTWPPWVTGVRTVVKPEAVRALEVARTAAGSGSLNPNFGELACARVNGADIRV